jgi:epoxyqueuosine reductase QueG/putative sterol carrier protein
LDETATPKGHQKSPKGHRKSSKDYRKSSKDYAFPFPAPGRPKQRALPPTTAFRWPFADMDAIDPVPVEPRAVRASVSVDQFKAHIASFTDDVGIISIDDPAIAHERDEILWVYPDAQSLVCLIGRENIAAMQSRYLPTANHELYSCEERIFEMGRKTVNYVESLGGAALTTTIGWPQEVSQRWADKIWPLSHKLVAQAAGLGVIGLSRNFLHHEFGAYCLIDTVITNLEFPPGEHDQPVEWNPCVNCNLCVAGCPTEAIKSDGEFDFFACYNHTYRDSIPGFMDLVRDLSDAKPRRFAKRWSDAEIAALWQSMAFRVEYRCFNCVSVCPANDLEGFHGTKQGRRDVLDRQLKPLTHARSTTDEQFAIDTPSARARYEIPPGHWRTPPDPAQPGQRGVRLVALNRIRTSSVDAMMRNMPHYFRGEEAGGLDFLCQFDLTGDGGGQWWLRVAEGRCQVEPGNAEGPDLTVRCTAKLFLAIHREESSAVLALLLGRIRLGGNRKLFLAFPRILGMTPNSGIGARTVWHGRRLIEKIQAIRRRKR